MPLSPLTPAVFPTPLDAASTTVSATYTAGGGSLTVASGSVFGAPSAGAPVRLTAVRASDSARVHYLLTHVSGNVLTVATADGYSDINLAVGDTVSVRINKGTLADIYTAIAADETLLNLLVAVANAAAVDTSVVHISGNETIAGTKTFSSTIAGSVSGTAGGLSSPIVESQVTNLTADLAGKQSTGNYLTALTGDVTASGPGSAAATLASTAVTPGSYTAANITVDSKGRLTAATNGSAGGTIASTSSVLKGNGSGGAVAATAGADYPGLATANTFLAVPQSIQQPTASPTVPWLNLTNSSGVTIGSFLASGSSVKLRLYETGNLASYLDINPGSGPALQLTGNLGTPVVSAAGFYTANLQYQNGNIYNISSQALTFDIAGQITLQCGRDVGGGKPLAFAGRASQTAPLTVYQQYSSASTLRNTAYIDAPLNTSTDASYSGDLVLYSGDFTSSFAGKREGLRVRSDGTQPLLGFYGATPVARAASPGTATGTDAAVVNAIVTALRNLGLIT